MPPLVDIAELLGTFSAFNLVVPDPVVVEIKISEQRQALRVTLSRQDLEQELLTALEELALHAEHRCVMGQGKAACLAMAESQDGMIASDERRRFHREMLSRLSKGSLVTTPGLLMLAI